MVGSEGSSLCSFLFPLSSLLLLPPAGTDGRTATKERGKNPWLVMSESCLNAQRGGRRERERDSKALSRVCAPARGARFPLGARAGAARVPRARQRSGLPRARVRARPGCRAPLSCTAAVRPAARQRLGSRGAAAATSWSSAYRVRGRVCERRRGEPQGGRGGSPGGRAG